MKKPKSATFGHPKDRTKPYVAHIYCAVHNGVPVMRDGADVEIGALYPMPMQIQPIGSEPKMVTMMVCGPCMSKIQRKAHENVMHMANTGSDTLKDAVKKILDEHKNKRRDDEDDGLATA